VVLEDPSRHISRRHAAINRQGSEYFVSVTAQLNYIHVNGQRLATGQQMPLKVGDQITIGDYELTLVPAENETPQAVTEHAEEPLSDPLSLLGSNTQEKKLDDLFSPTPRQSSPSTRGSLDELLGSSEESKSPDPVLDILAGKTPRAPARDAFAHDDQLGPIFEPSESSRAAEAFSGEILPVSDAADLSIDALLGPSPAAIEDPLGLRTGVPHSGARGQFGGGIGGSLELDHVHDVHLPLPGASPERARLDAPARPMSIRRSPAAPQPAVRREAPEPRPTSGQDDDPLAALSDSAPSRRAPSEDFPPSDAPAPEREFRSAIRFFLDGAGMADVRIADANAEVFLRECGATVRAAVEGMMAMLLARAKVKEELRASDRTMVSSKENNALKLAETVDEALRFVFDPVTRTAAFLPPPRAVADACNDLHAHELALVAGMRAALLGAIKRFEPAIIEKRLERQGGKSLLANRKALLWDQFVAYYEETEKDADDRFDDVFGAAFLSAYQEQIRRLRG
jgi:predicted component of type VI protein secretion system